MQFSQKDIKKISEQSSTLRERISAEFINYEISKNEAVINSRLAQWCDIVSQGDWEKFEQRLAWDNLDLKIVSSALSPVVISDDNPFPIWTQTLNQYLKAISNLDILKQIDSERSCLFNSKEPLPFEEVLLPFIYVARDKLCNQVGSNYKLISNAAHTSLERSLLKWLVHLCSQSMELEFSVFRASRQSTLFSRLQKSADLHSSPYYQDFIISLLEGGLLLFFQQYPVLARLVATATDAWVDATGEFISRLASDWSDIQITFQPDEELGQIVAVQPDLSDRHNGGRSVMIITFASGLKLVYKPRNLDIEKAYIKLLGWLNEHGVPLPFKLFQILNYSDYGWVEFIEALSCKNKEESTRYYQRCGILLCLGYVLYSTDLHHENIVACGEYPVLIDMETLMHPWVREVEEIENDSKSAKSFANQHLWHSVIRTALLPQWHLGQKGHVYDTSALGGITQADWSNQQKERDETNTDTIEEKEELLSNNHPKSNAPSFDKTKQALENYHEEIINGFEQMYRFFIENRQALLAPEGGLIALASQSIRFLFRNTSTYTSLLYHTLNPKYLRDGVERSIQIDVLSKAMLISNTKPLCWQILKVEQQALEQLDVPLFTARSDSDSLTINPNQTIEKYFTEPSFNLVISRLNQLNEKDLEQQISFIKGSLYSRTTKEIHNLLQVDNTSLALDAFVSLAQEDLLKQAIMVATDIEKQAIRSTDGSVIWVAPQFIKEAQRFQFQSMGHGLFDGSCGIALFLAALNSITGEYSFRVLALSALQSLRQDLQEALSTNIFKPIEIGGCIGYGGIIYVLVRVSQFLEEPVFLEDAKQVASLITSDLIAADKKFDIFLGTAGAILGLLALHNISADTEFLEQAITCGNHLLNNRVASDSNYRTWATLDGKLLTGFSHGAAGIAYALIRLYKVTGEISFLEAAAEAIVYESNVFIPEVNNWPDFRQPSIKERPICMCSWCHGAPGIGLARLGGLDILDTPKIRQDIEAAIYTTNQHKLSNIDHLCCGNLGRVEFLFTAARKLSQPELHKVAMEQAGQVVARAKQIGGFAYSPILGYNPGFFQGAAGIGYELLRLAFPEVLPSVLLWE